MAKNKLVKNRHYLGFYIEEELYSILSDYAYNNGETVSQWARHVIEEAVNKLEKE